MAKKAENIAVEPAEIKEPDPFRRVEYTEYPPNEELEDTSFTVNVNGYRYRINYGEPVMLPDFVAQALKNRRENVKYAKKNDEKFKKKAREVLELG